MTSKDNVSRRSNNIVTVNSKGKTDTNSCICFKSISVHYPFVIRSITLKKLFKHLSRASLWPWLNLNIINKIQTGGL